MKLLLWLKVLNTDMCDFNMCLSIPEYASEHYSKEKLELIKLTCQASTAEQCHLSETIGYFFSCVKSYSDEGICILHISLNLRSYPINLSNLIGSNRIQFSNRTFKLRVNGSSQLHSIENVQKIGNTL